MNCLQKLVVVVAACWITQAITAAQTRPATMAATSPAQQVDPWQKRLAWYQRTMVEAYDKVGKHNEKWDKQAHMAIAELVHAWTSKPPEDLKAGNQAIIASRTAIAAGCDDPMVIYANAASREQFGRPGQAELIKLYAQAALGIKDSAYPPFWKAQMIYRAGYVARWYNAKAPWGYEVWTWIDLALDQFPEALSDGDVPFDVARELCDGVIALQGVSGRDRKLAFDVIEAALNANRPASYLSDIIAGKYYTDYAWDGRGSGAAGTVTDEGWKLMRDRLEEAEKALGEAWKLDPSRPEAPTLMLRVELGQGKGRDVMEQWFARAMKADPNNYAACSVKLLYLEPKWHGSEEEMLKFGEDLLKQGNWKGRLPYILVDARHALAHYQEDGWHPEESIEYLHRPEVWGDIARVHKAYLLHSPDDRYARTNFFLMSAYYDRWEDAREQAIILGDNPDLTAAPSKNEYERVRKLAMQGGPKNGEKRAGPPPKRLPSGPSDSDL